MRSMANVERPMAAVSDSFDGWAAAAFFAAEVDRERTQHIDGGRLDRMRRRAATVCAPSGSAGADTVVPSFSPVTRLEAASRDALAFNRHAAPVHDKVGGKLHVAVIRLRKRRVGDPTTRRCRCRRGRTTSTLSSSIERVEPTSNASNSRCTASNTATEIRSGIDQPVGVLERCRPVGPAARAECRGKDAGVADAGAAELDAAGKQRYGANAELDGLGLEHGEPSALALSVMSGTSTARNCERSTETFAGPRTASTFMPEKPLIAVSASSRSRSVPSPVVASR